MMQELNNGCALTGGGSFLNCIAWNCCGRPCSQIELTEEDIERGFPVEHSVGESGNRYIRFEEEGCTLLDNETGCPLSPDKRPIRCLTCPFLIDKDDNVLAFIGCPDVDNLARRIARNEKEAVAYLKCAVKLLVEHPELLERLRKQPEDFRVTLNFGHVSKWLD